MTNNFQFPQAEKITKPPQLAYSERKFQALITAINQRTDKNGKDYWVVYTQLDNQTTQSYLAFSLDYNGSPQVPAILTNPKSVLNKTALLTIREKGHLRKIIDLAISK